MMHEAAASGWYDNGPADFEEPPSALATDYPIDGDSDDGSVAAAPPTQSVTNSLGQEIGKNLNVSA